MQIKYNKKKYLIRNLSQKLSMPYQNQDDMFLSKQELKTDQIIRGYLLMQRKREQLNIKNQSPNMIDKKSHFLLSLVVTICIVILNYDHLFPEKQVTQTGLAEFQNYQEIEEKVEYVFQQTIMKYSIIYPFKIKQCRSLIPFVKQGTLCSEKSIQVKAKFVYDIGFRPNFQKLSYDSRNNTVVGEWGQLEILGLTDQRIIESEKNGFINSWSVLEFQQKYDQIKKAVKPQMEQKINGYISNITENSRSIQKFQNNIRNSLMSIVGNRKNSRESLSKRLLTTVNGLFDKVLISISMNPIFKEQRVVQKNGFSKQDVTQFWEEEILVGEQLKQIQEQIDKIIYNNNIQKANKPEGKKLDEKNKQSKINKQAEKIDKDLARLKYNELLKKIQ